MSELREGAIVRHCNRGAGRVLTIKHGMLRGQPSKVNVAFDRDRTNPLWVWADDLTILANAPAAPTAALRVVEQPSAA